MSSIFTLERDFVIESPKKIKNQKPLRTRIQRHVSHLPNNIKMTFGKIFFRLTNQFGYIIRTNTEFHKKNHTNSQIWWWLCDGLACFAASGRGRLAIIHGTMKCALYQKILKDYVHASVHALKIKSTRRG